MITKHIRPRHFSKTPFPHIFCNQLVDVDEYNRLYENWNNPTHEYWNTFKKKYNVEITQYNNLCDVDIHNNDVVCYWFFKQRGFEYKLKQYSVNGISMRYTANSALICRSSDEFCSINNNTFENKPVCVLVSNTGLFSCLLQDFL